METDTFVTMRDYSENSAVQNKAAFRLSEMIEQVLGGMDFSIPSESTQIIVVEFGCATGSSSIDPLNQILRASKVNGRRICAVMNDLPLNDWDTLQTTLKEKVPKVDVQVSCQSMYKDVVAAPGSVDIAYSCFAQHWLSKGVPRPLPVNTGALWGNQLAGLLEYEEIHDEWARASSDDWDRFLELRAQEIRAGGVLMLLIYSAQHNGSLWESMAEACRLAKKQCLVDGIFTVDEASCMCAPEYAKTRDEILKPLTDGPHASKWAVLECRHNLFHHNDDPNISGQEKAKKAVALARSFIDSSFEQAFDESVREYKMDIFWQTVYLQLGENDDLLYHVNNYGETMIALKRKDSHN